MHKKKRLVQGPDSFFMDVKCKGTRFISVGAHMLIYDL